MAQSSECTSIREMIIQRSFTHWRGFNETCTPALLLERPPLDFSEAAFWNLGDSRVRSAFIPVVLVGYDRARVSYQEGRAVLFSAAYPEIAGNLKSLLDELSEPAAKLDWHHGLLEMPTGEWVYSSRGITLFLNSSFENLLHIALYAATTLNDYTTRLRPDLQVRKLPMKR